MAKSIAVVLSGCGVYDGTEVHEAAAVCVALSRAGMQIAFYAPNQTQHHVINHINGESDEQDRNILIESGRIARGKVYPLADLRADSYDAVIFPGGFGAAKNLSTFGTASDPVVQDDVIRVLKEFHGEKKPIGMCCIAPIMAAIVFGSQEKIPVKLTLGKKEPAGDWPYATAVEKASQFGAQVEELGVDEICVDEENKIVTTPAYMYHSAAFHEIHDGVEKMVKKTIEMI